jgi:hypothetical protein
MSSEPGAFYVRYFENQASLLLKRMTGFKVRVGGFFILAPMLHNVLFTVSMFGHKLSGLAENRNRMKEDALYLHSQKCLRRTSQRI